MPTPPMADSKEADNARFVTTVRLTIQPYFQWPEPPGGGSVEARSLAKDLAPPARSGIISAVLAFPRPLKRERRPPSRAVSSPPKALRERLQPYLLAPYWPETGHPLWLQPHPHPLCIRCAYREYGYRLARGAPGTPWGWHLTDGNQ